jgi:uncharacterized lipoprotein YehR (DUF1307 family)
MECYRRLTVVLLTGLLLAVSISGCGKKADESKPMSEVKAEAEKMDTAKLRTMAQQYKSALVAKKAEVDKLTAKIKDIPIAQALGEEAKKLKSDVDNLQKSVSALQERFTVYYEKLKEKKGDLSGLELP